MIAFIITLGLTWYMTGMIWSMQLLEYPLFALVGPKEFPAYHRRHNRGGCPCWSSSLRLRPVPARSS